MELFTVIVFSVVVAGAVYATMRGAKVLRFRDKLTKQVNKAARTDKNRGISSKGWRKQVLNSVPFWRMVLSIRRLEPASYYESDLFLRPTKTKKAAKT